MRPARPPWVSVAAPTNPPPLDQPIKIWFDTGSGPGLEIDLPAEERWRLWPTGRGHVLLTDAEADDAAAQQILDNVRALWASYGICQEGT